MPVFGGWRLKALLLAAVALLCGSGVYLIDKERRTVWSSTEQHLMSLSVAVESSMTTALRQAEFSLRGIENELQAAPRPPHYGDLLAQAAKFDPVSAVLGILKNGRLQSLFTNGVPLPDRQCQQLTQDLLQSVATADRGHARVKADDLMILPMVQHPVTSEWLLPLFFTGHDAAGSPIQIFALIPAQTLTQSMTSLRVLPGSFMSVVSMNGVQLFRYLPEEHVFVLNDPFVHPEVLPHVWTTKQVVFQARNVLDGQLTMYSHARSDILPFSAGVGVPVSQIRETWFKAAAAPFLVMLLGILGILAFWFMLCRSVRVQLAEAHAHAHAARHDALTGVLNRDAFAQLLERDIQSLAAPAFSVVLIDLNRFREINDTMGHEAGDRVLKEVVRRISRPVQVLGGVVARVGGDEFGLKLPFLPELGDGVLLDLHAAIGHVMPVGEVDLEITAAMGVASFPSDADSVKDLVRRANIAMHKAKSEVHAVEHYRPELDRFSMTRLGMHSELARAIREGQLSLVFQPKVSLKNGTMVGVEALVRWARPGGRTMSPAEFVPLAESTELIHPFTSLVIRRALQAQKHWIQHGVRVPVAVNVSANNLLSVDFVPDLKRLLAEFDIPASLLELEITESAVMRSPELIIPRLASIRDMGVRLAIDDFGTGFASLAYLKLLPVHVLKIDLSFVVNMDSDVANEKIVRSTIALAHSFDLTVVAEGVETEAVRDMLAQYQCDAAQGYLFSRPVDSRAIAVWADRSQLAVLDQA